MVLAHIFHPRREDALKPFSDKDLSIPVEAGVEIGACFHVSGKTQPTILFFHGNGEIVSDYDDLGGIYNRMGINFLVVDYRGYGRSTGEPSVAAMMTDCHVILDFVQNYLRENGFTGTLTLMGRSLGSASVLELVFGGAWGVDHLIIESGFAHAGKLLRVLGIDPHAIGFNEEQGFGNAEKIRAWNGPTLIIHAQYDHIIPFSDGQALYDACPASRKTLLQIPGANHNDIFMRGLNEYMTAVKKLVG
jgi:hypothetical protein